MKKITSLLLVSTLLLSSACGTVRKETANVGITPASSQSVTGNAVTAETTVGEVLSMPEFQNFGRLLFPVDRTVSEDMTLEQVSSSRVYTWYHNIQPEKTVEIINHLIRQADDDQPIFYSIYSESEMQADPSKQDTGLFFFKGESGAKFSIMTAGGGFAYVGAMHDSFPQALELSKMGYNAFALIYRPDDPYRDLAQAITYIYDHAAELEVDPGDYSLWGGSAGARMAATLGNAENLRTLTARTDIPQAAAVITQYTGYQSVSASDAPTYACVGTSDSIASARTMQNRLDALQKLGIPTEFHAYENLPHGFGLGTGTAAEGWIQDAVRFWEDQMPDESIPTARQTAIATKFGIGFDKSGGKIPYPLVADARPETIRKSVEGSLKRLGVECIDLYYQHRIDPNTSPEEVADVIAKLIQEGKIRHWGISECDESYLRRAHAVCPVTAIQNRYSMMYRNYEQLFPVLEELGVALVAFSPLANGFLSGRYDANSRFEAGTDYRGTMPQFQAEAVAENQELLAYLHQIAAEKQATLAQIALAWMLCKKPWIIPIPGTRNPERMQENANAADVALSPAEVEKIDAMLDKIPMSAVYGGVATRGNA